MDRTHGQTTCRSAGRLLLGGLLWAGLCSAPHADDAWVSVVGGAAKLMQGHPSIAMESCRVEGMVGADSTQVRCEFVFLNDGPPTTVTMGFPAWAYAAEEKVPSLAGFRSWVDGKAVTVRGRTESPEDGPPVRWYTKDIEFAAGQRRTVRDEYVQPHFQQIGGPWAFPYELNTGASWHGPIGHVEIIVQWTGPYHWGGTGEPPGFAGWQVAPDGRQLRLVRENLEPTSDDDIWLSFHRGWPDLTCDGVRLAGGVEAASCRVDWGDEIWMPADALGRILQSDDTWERARRRVRLVTKAGQSVEFRVGRSTVAVSGQPVPLPAAPYLDRDRTWLPVSEILPRLGLRFEVDASAQSVHVFTGGPVAQQVRGRWDPPVEDEEPARVYLVWVDGTLLADADGLVDAVPELYFGDAQESALVLERGPRVLKLALGAKQAELGGELIELPTGPYRSVSGSWMVPLEAVCGAFGVQYRYDEPAATLVLSAAPATP